MMFLCSYDSVYCFYKHIKNLLDIAGVVGNYNDFRKNACTEDVRKPEYSLT